jgi:hypothetical protein
MRGMLLAALALAVLLASCSSGSGSSSGGGGSSSTFVPGKWTAGIDLSGNGMIGPTFEVDMNLTQSGNTISSNSDNTVDSLTCGAAHVDSTTGTVNGDQFKLVISINSETATLTGTLNADGKSVNELKTKVVSSQGGVCFNGLGGGFGANFVPALTGTFTGTMQVNGAPAAPAVTAMLTEDPSFDLMGSMVVTGDPCFSSLAIAAANPGTSIGSVSEFEMTDGTNIVDFTGHILTSPATAFEYDGNLIVTSGCTEEFGTITLDPEAAAAMGAPATSNSKNAVSAIDPVLAERLKVLAAARRASIQKWGGTDDPHFKMSTDSH